MSVSSTVGALQRAQERYSVTASFDPEKNEISTNKITGDRNSGLFSANDQIGKMQFLQLLTTQLQYQDPLSPMENTEFVAQLAMFSQLESTSSMEAAMQRMASTFQDSMDLQNFNAQSTTNAASVSLVGKQVRLRENTFNYTGSQSMSFQAHLGERERAVVNIVDGDGNVVKSIQLSGKDDTNAVKFTWDGRDERGQRVPNDKYNLVIVGQERDEALYCFVEDIVTGIRYTNRGTLVRVDNREIPVSDILEVKTPGSGSGSSGNTVTANDLTMAQALGLVGFNVKAKTTDKLTYTPAPNQQISFNLDLGGAPNATILVRDKNGVEVDRIAVNADELSRRGGRWELDKKAYGNTGEYTVEISESNKLAYFFVAGPITGVVNHNGFPQLKMDGRTVSITQIMELSKAAA